MSNAKWRMYNRYVLAIKIPLQFGFLSNFKPYTESSINMPDNQELEKNYGLILQSLKEKIRQARQRASLAVNTKLLEVYWEIGNTILEQQKSEGWGTKVIKRLAADLKAEFPDMKGLSERNLVYMQSFAAAYPNFAVTQQAAAKFQNIENQSIIIMQEQPAQLEKNLTPFHLANLSWYHHTTLLDKVKEPKYSVKAALGCPIILSMSGK